MPEGKDLTRKRLLLEFEHSMREHNRSLINSEIKTLALEDLEPIITMVARSRAAYVAELFALAEQDQDAAPDVSRLAELRATFDELVAASNALETMIERGYLDIHRPS